MLIEAHRDNKSTRQQSDWKDFLQLYFTKITVYTVIFNFSFPYIGTYNIFAVLPQRYTAAFRRFIGRCRNTAFHVAVFGSTDG